MIPVLDRLIGAFRGTVDDFGGDLGLSSELSLEPGSTGLCVLMPPWKTEADYYKPVRKRIRARGYSCLEYRVTSSLISPDHTYTAHSFMAIRDQAVADIERLVREHGFTAVQVIGVSIGCVEAAMVANSSPHVTKAVLVAPGNCLAESLWHGLKTRNVRALFEEQGISLAEVKRAWAAVSPENNLSGLRGKEIEVYLSKSDGNIPYRFGRSLVQSMRAAGLEPAVFENAFLGHYGTVLNYLWRGKIV